MVVNESFFKPPSRPYMKIRWRPPPRLQWSIAFSPGSGAWGKGCLPPTLVASMCSHGVRKELPFVWYKLQVITRLQYDECSAIDIPVCMLYHVIMCDLLFRCTYTQTYCIIDRFMLPKPWPTESKDTNWACSISSPWSGRKRMSTWIACMFQWTLTRPRSYVPLVQNHKGGPEVLFWCRSSSHTARW